MTLLFEEFEDLVDDGSHVIVFVFSKTASKDGGVFLLGENAVFLVDYLVFGIVDGVEWFHAVLPFGGVFTGDYRLGVVIYCVAESLEVLVLDYPGERDIGRGVVYHGVSLPVGVVEGFRLETDCAVFQFAEAITIELVDLTGEDNLVGH